MQSPNFPATYDLAHVPLGASDFHDFLFSVYRNSLMVARDARKLLLLSPLLVFRLLLAISLITASSSVSLSSSMGINEPLASSPFSYDQSVGRVYKSLSESNETLPPSIPSKEANRRKELPCFRLPDEEICPPFCSIGLLDLLGNSRELGIIPSALLATVSFVGLFVWHSKEKQLKGGSNAFGTSPPFFSTKNNALNLEHSG